MTYASALTEKQRDTMNIPTLAPLAAPRGAGQPVGAALPELMKHPPTLAPLAAPQGAGQSVGAALPELT
jgi:hypothetical protein